MRLLFAVLLIGLLAAPPALFACSCTPPPPPKEALAQSAAVFAGKVTAVEKAGEFEIAVTLEVSQTWKGVKARKVTLYTANNGAICGVGFKEGATYLVYAHQQKRGDVDVLATNLCTRTTSLEAAAADLKDLGDGTPVK
jgi:hypothetical protein